MYNRLNRLRFKGLSNKARRLCLRTTAKGTPLEPFYVEFRLRFQLTFCCPPFRPLDQRGIAVLDFSERSEDEILEQLGGYVFYIVVKSSAYPSRNSKARSSPRVSINRRSKLERGDNRMNRLSSTDLLNWATEWMRKIWSVDHCEAHNVEWDDPENPKNSLGLPRPVSRK